MKPEDMDMSTPVTRGELREEIELLDQRFKGWLEIWAGALLARMDDSEQRLTRRIDGVEQRLTQRIDGVEQRIDDVERRIDGLEVRIGGVELRFDVTEQRIDERFASMEQRLSEELARHTNAILESMTTQIAVIDEKYSDLPARMRQVEGQVFPLQRR